MTEGGSPVRDASLALHLSDVENYAQERETPRCPHDELCARLGDVFNAPDSAKGDALETFVEFAFGCFPDLFVDEGKRRRVLERDRVVTIRRVPATCVASWPATHLAVDCRNRNEKYSSDDVASFLSRLNESRTKVGIIVAVSGITTQGVASAAQAILQAWDRDNIALGVVSGDELKQLCTSDESEPSHWLGLLHEAVIRAQHGTRYRS